MTDNELNRDIHALLGWIPDEGLGGFWHPDRPEQTALPDYCNDHGAALRLLEHVLTQTYKETYVFEVNNIDHWYRDMWHVCIAAGPCDSWQGEAPKLPRALAEACHAAWRHVEAST